MEAYFTKLMAKANAILATKEEDLTAFDRESIDHRMKSSHSMFIGSVILRHKGYQNKIYQDEFRKEMIADYLRRKAAQEIANFYHHPELNGSHEIVEDTLTYLNEITADDFEQYIDDLKQEGMNGLYDEVAPTSSPEQDLWALEIYGHTIPAAIQFLNEVVDLMTLAIHSLGIHDRGKIQSEIAQITRKWRSGWEDAGIDDTETLERLLNEFNQKKAIDWANARFSAPKEKGTADYEPRFSETFFYQDAKKHVALFDRNRFKSNLKGYEKKGYHYEDTKESAIQFIKDYWLDDHYKACGILGKDASILDDIVERMAASFYDLPVLDIRTRFPEKFRKPKDKLSRTVFDGQDRLFDEEFKALGMESKNAARAITTYAKISFDKGFSNISMPNLSPYENVVHDAIGSLYYEGGNKYITPGMINKAITGDAKARLTKSKRIDIMKAVSKLMHSAIEIKSKDENYQYNGHILDARMITKLVTIQGKKEPQDAVIEILGGMPLYEYAGKKKQIITGPMEYLNPPLNMTKETILLTDFLLKRISWKESKIVILYSTLYEQLGIDKDDRKSKNQRAKIRQQALTILNYWKDKAAPVFGGNIIKKVYEQNDKGQPLKPRQRAYRLVILKGEPA
jgi:hypothetical protein